MAMPHALQTVAGHAMLPVPLRALERLAPRTLIAFCYHVVTEHPPPHVAHVIASKTPRQFERDLEFIAKHYVPISYADLKPGSPSGDGRRPAAIVTFDDGLRECYSVVRPLLKKHGVPAIFFVTTGFLDNQRLFYRHRVSLCVDAYLRASRSQQASARKAMAEIVKAPIADTPHVIATLLTATVGMPSGLDQICTCLGVDTDGYLLDATPYLSSAEVRSLVADGFTMGAHGRSHLPLTSMAPSDAEADIVESCARMAELTDQASVPYAFPFNGRGVSRTLLRQIRDAHGEVGLFFDTQGIAEDSADVVNRIVADHPARSGHAAASLSLAIRLAYARELARMLRRRVRPRKRGD